MEFTVHLATPTPDIGAIERALYDVDPACVVDLDAHHNTLRISTNATDDELLSVLAQSGHPIPPDQLKRVPSVCCGGCGG